MLWLPLQLGQQCPYPPVDLIPDGAHIFERPARRVGQLPVEVAPAREVGARVPAAHGDHDIGFFTVSAFSTFGTSLEMSMPTSAIAATTAGFSSLAGAEPAERTSTFPAA